MDKHDIDKLADSAAKLAREIRSLRGPIAAIVEQSDFGDGEFGSHVDELLNAIAGVEMQLGDHLVRLQPIINRKAEAVARAKRLGGQDAEHLAGNAFTRVGSKIHQFDSGTQQRCNGDTSAFEAWISTLIERLAIDEFRRRARGEIQATERQLEWHSRETGELATATQRAVPAAFQTDEEQALDAIPAERRHLFLYMTGLWQLVSDKQRQAWVSFPAPSQWELEELNAWQRANHFVLALAEREFTALAQQHPELTDADFDAIYTRIAQRSAHNLRRHFWIVLKLETAWAYLFRKIAPLPETILNDVDRSINARSLVAWLVLDLWFACDRAERWFRWLAEANAVNRLDCNLGILMDQQIAKDGDSQLNRHKIDLACRFVGCNPIDSDDIALLLRESPDHSAELFATGCQIQVGKRDLDVCLAYHTLRQPPLQIIHPDAENGQ